MYQSAEIRSQSVFKALQAEGALSTTMARYYQPNVGRFVSEDPYGLGRPDPEEIEFDEGMIDEWFIGWPDGDAVLPMEIDTPGISDDLPSVGMLPTYSYAYNSPINYFDPSGEWGWVRPLIPIIIKGGKHAVRGMKHAWKFCKNIRCTPIRIDGPKHSWGGKKYCHLQMDCYIKGMKGSGKVHLRMRIPCTFWKRHPKGSSH